MHLTRRYFLKSTGAIATYLGVAPMNLFAQVGEATDAPQKVTRGKTLVVIFLRGGADGLNLVIPHGDPNYTRLRRSIAIPHGGDNGIVDLDGFFGLHPRMASMKPFFDNGTAVAAHAVGYDQNTRSHFEEQDVWETGVIGNTINSDGWLNRHLATSEGRGPIRAVAIGDALPRILHGEEAAYAIRGIEDLTLPAHGRASSEAIIEALEHAYCSKPDEERVAARDMLSQTAGLTLDGVKELRAVASKPYTPAAEYPNTELGRRLRQAARLIKADVGLEVVEVDYGGWDTHANQGGVYGQFGNLTANLGASMAAFCRDLEDRLDDVLVMTLTDFGRTAAENGTGGTDHGWANCMFLAGGPVKRANEAAAESRKVVSKWPGLAPDQLHQGRDLLHTMDFRDVLADVVQTHLGNPHLKTVLPGHEFTSTGLVV